MKKFISIAMSTALLIASAFSAIADGKVNAVDLANKYGLSSETIEFLEEHNVSLSIFDNVPTEGVMLAETESNPAGANSYNESIFSLMNSSKAYDFTDEQIQEYVLGLTKTPTTIVDDNVASELAVANPPSSTNRPSDDGVGWEVKSNYGFYQTTTFATLPTVTNKVIGVAPYMFFTVTKDNNWGIDVGVGYETGSDGTKWRGCYTANGSLVYGSEIGSNYLYFDASVLSSGYLRFRVLDGNDFSNVFYDISYYVGDKGITTTNASFNRQITLCDGNKKFNTGTKITNAKFANSYVYSTSGYANTGTSNCDSNYCGRFGTNSTTAKKVTVNSYYKWYSEDISISF